MQKETVIPRYVEPLFDALKQGDVRCTALDTDVKRSAVNWLYRHNMITTVELTRSFRIIKRNWI